MQSVTFCLFSVPIDCAHPFDFHTATGLSYRDTNNLFIDICKVAMKGIFYSNRIDRECQCLLLPGAEKKSGWDGVIWAGWTILFAGIVMNPGGGRWCVLPVPAIIRDGIAGRDRTIWEGTGGARGPGRQRGNGPGGPWPGGVQ